MAHRPHALQSATTNGFPAVLQLQLQHSPPPPPAATPFSLTAAASTLTPAPLNTSNQPH